MAISRRLAIIATGLVFIGITSCKTCPIDACHVRMKHAHGDDEFRGQPIWKKQNPKIGEKLPKRSVEKSAPKHNKSKNKN
jgi:hypothetical protein